MKRFALLLTGLAFLSACEDDDTDAGANVDADSGRKAIIAIEGNSPNGISSLAAYDITTKTVENNLFRKANINPMGSQISDIMYDEERNRLVLIVPGSNKIVLTSASTYEIERQLSELMQIREVAKMPEAKYYITSPELEGFYIMNAENGNIREEYQTFRTNPTAIEAWEDFAFICNSGDAFLKDSTVSIIRSTADTLVLNLNVGHSPNSIVIDEENQMWVLCGGEFNATNPAISGVGSLWKFNLDTLTMAIDSGWTIMPDTVKYFTDNQLRPNTLTYDYTIGNLYYIGNSPTGNLISTNKNNRPINEIPLVSGNFYGLGFDVLQLELYGFRTPFNEEDNGDLQIFDPAGNLKTSITIGVKPKRVVFK
jgi:hypothetical protein